MRDGKLGAGARSLILKSCELLLADALMPARSFKNYTPRMPDSPLYTCNSVLLSQIHVQLIISPVQATIAADASVSSEDSPVTLPLSESTPDTPISPFVRDVVEDWPDTRQSPAASQSESSLATQANEPKDSKPKEEEGVKEPWHESLRHIDTDWSMRAMDALFNASFTEFVKNEKNCECTGRHLCRVIKEFKLDQVVLGLRWLVDGWPIESTARLLKTVFDDWLPELAALAVAQIGINWPIRPKMSLIVAYMMMSEKVNVVALFLKSLTLGWAPVDVTDLISCLDSVLEWDDKFFNDFTEVFISELIEGRDRGEVRGQDPEIMIKALASMYKTSISSTNFRIVLADLRLSVAKSNYLTHYNHYLSCENCLSQRPCDFAETTRFPTPSVIMRVTRGRNTEDHDGLLLEGGDSMSSPSVIIPASALAQAAAAAAAAHRFLAEDRPVSSSSILDTHSWDEDVDFASQRPSVVDSELGSMWTTSNTSTTGGIDVIDRWHADIDAELAATDAMDNDIGYDNDGLEYNFNASDHGVQEVDDGLRNEDPGQFISFPRRIVIPSAIAAPRRRFTPLPPIPRSTTATITTTEAATSTSVSTTTSWVPSRRIMTGDNFTQIGSTTTTTDIKSDIVSRTTSSISFDINATLIDASTDECSKVPIVSRESSSPSLL